MSDATLKDASAMRIMARLGLVEDVKKRAGLTIEQIKQATADPGWMKFYSGEEGHELIHDVCDA